MRKFATIIGGLQILVLTAAMALPAQAAINIGAPQANSGSVVSLRSGTVSGSQTVVSYYTGSSTQASTSTNSTTTTATYVSPVSAPTTGTSVVSLSNYLNRNYTAPTTTTATQTNTGSQTTTSTTTSTTTTQGSYPAIPRITSLTADQQAIIDMVNQERVNAGLAPLKVDFRLVSVGQAKADDMKNNNYFDHISPTYGTPWAMMAAVGLNPKWAGENIAYNSSVAAVMRAWMQSPGHRANILDPKFTHIGVGVAYRSASNLYVQEFAQE